MLIALNALRGADTDTPHLEAVRSLMKSSPLIQTCRFLQNTVVQ